MTARFWSELVLHQDPREPGSGVSPDGSLGVHGVAVPVVGVADERESRGRRLRDVRPTSSISPYETRPASGMAKRAAETQKPDMNPTLNPARSMSAAVRASCAHGARRISSPARSSRRLDAARLDRSLLEEADATGGSTIATATDAIETSSSRPCGRLDERGARRRDGRRGRHRRAGGLSDVCESMSSRRCRDRTAASPGDDEMKYEL